MESTITIGQRFTFTILSANPAQERQAVVTRVLSNREEGMGPEVDYYFAYWVEAHELPETAAPTTLVFERGNDGNVYLEFGGKRSCRSSVLNELDRVIGLIADSPDRFLIFDGDPRRAVFPFYVVFRADDLKVVVLAVAHGKRRPRFWHNRS